MMAAGPEYREKPDKQRLEEGKRWFNQGAEYRAFFNGVKDIFKKTLPKPEQFTKVPHVWEFNHKLEIKMTNRRVDKEEHSFKDKLKEIEVGKFMEGFKKTIEVPRISHFQMLPKESKVKKTNNIADSVVDSMEPKVEAPSGMRTFVPIYELQKVEVVAYSGDALALTGEEMTTWEVNAAYFDPPWGLNPDLQYDKKAFTGAEVIRVSMYTLHCLSLYFDMFICNCACSYILS